MIYETVSAPVSSKDDLLKQLRNFLAGASGTNRPPLKPALCSTALYLLSHLPASREAVLEYFGYVLDGIVARYNPQAGNQDDRQNQNYNEDEEIVLDELSKTLSGLVTSSPSPWAPVLSTWCTECLGKLSSKWSNKLCGKTNILHEKLTAWMNCNVGRVLLDLSAECLTKLMDAKVDTKMMSDAGPGVMSDTESCIAALLETSVKHTPHFDWVLAHIGSCFPQTVPHRVLTVGLKDFISSCKDSGPNVSHESILSKTPRLSSVVNILSHLSSTHISDVQKALHQVLVSSLKGSQSAVNIATLPFLLSLASVSSDVRRALTSDLADILPPVLGNLRDLYSHWSSGYFSGNNSLLTAVTQLLLVSDSGGPQLLLLLLEAGAGTDKVISQAAKTLFNTILSELFTQIHSLPKNRTEDIALFSGIHSVLGQFKKKLLSEDSFSRDSTAVFLYLYSLHKGRSVSAGCIKYLLSHSTTATHMRTCLQLVEQLEQFHIHVVNDAVTLAIRDVNTDKRTLITNLHKLCIGEFENNPNSWKRAVSNSYLQLGEMLGTMELTEEILQLLLAVPLEKNMRVRDIHRISQTVVNVILNTITCDDLFEDKLKRVTGCETILHQLSSQKCGLNIILRFLLDACLNTKFCIWLGGKLSAEDSSVRQKTAVSLLHSNYKHGTKPVQPLGSTVTFHAGVIGAGARPDAPDPVVSKEHAEVNRRLISGVIQRLCETGGQEGAKQMSLMLVEIISPDIMYNGLPWPDEEFIKVTIERDLCISRVLARHPITWTLLSILARTRPALCYCSVLIRAVLAVLISHWSSHVTSSLTHHPQQLDVTVKVLDLMAVGQFIPAQLALVPHIIHILDPFQLHCILIDIWNFMKNYVPGPSLYVATDQESGQMTRVFGHYKTYHGFCERLRVVLVKNLDTMAVLFKKHFVDALVESVDKNGQNGHC